MLKKISLIILTILLISAKCYAGNYCLENKYILDEGYSVNNFYSDYTLESFPSGILSSWYLDEGSGQELEDSSDVTNNNPLMLGSTTGVDTNDPTWGTGCLGFDGVDNFARQEIIDSEQGTVRISIKDGSAYLWDDGQDFTDYAGAAGSDKDYMVVIEDAGDDIAWGYIGEEMNGETLGEELVTNGNFTSDASGWTVGKNGILSSITGGQSGNCGELENGAAEYGIASQEVAITLGKLYKYSIYHKNASGIKGIFRIGNGADSANNLTLNINDTTWTLYEGYFVATTVPTVITLRVWSDVMGAATLFDSVSVKEVLAVPANEGIKLYSTKDGSTQNLADCDGSFAPNDTLTYEVRKTTLQFTDAVTVAAVIRPTDDPADYSTILGKVGQLTAISGFLLFLHSDRTIQFWVGDGTDWVGVDDTTTELANDTWYIVFGIYDGTNMKVYVENVQDGTDTAQDVWPDNDGAFTLGHQEGDVARFFKGDIAVALLYNRALSADEIYKLCTAIKIQAINQGVVF